MRTAHSLQEELPVFGLIVKVTTVDVITKTLTVASIVRLAISLIVSHFAWHIITGRQVQLESPTRGVECIDLVSIIWKGEPSVLVAALLKLLRKLTQSLVVLGVVPCPMVVSKLIEPTVRALHVLIVDRVHVVLQVGDSELGSLSVRSLNKVHLSLSVWHFHNRVEAPRCFSDVLDNSATKSSRVELDHLVKLSSGS